VSIDFFLQNPDRPRDEGDHAAGHGQTLESMSTSGFWTGIGTTKADSALEHSPMEGSHIAAQGWPSESRDARRTVGRRNFHFFHLKRSLFISLLSKRAIDGKYLKRSAFEELIQRPSNLSVSVSN
jgi:hypothetical protein